MKKLLFLFILTLATQINLSAQAENYGSVEWELFGLKYGIPTGAEGVAAGIGFYSEPRFNLKDNISLSLRWEGMIFGSDFDGASIGISTSFGLFGDYYLSTSSGNRPFVGLGIGNYKGGTVEVAGVSSPSVGSALGIVPRIGYELSFLRVALDYTLSLDSDKFPNYMGISVGLNILGGKK